MNHTHFYIANMIIEKNKVSFVTESILTFIIYSLLLVKNDVYFQTLRNSKDEVS